MTPLSSKKETFRQSRPELMTVLIAKWRAMPCDKGDHEAEMIEWLLGHWDAIACEVWYLRECMRLKEKPTLGALQAFASGFMDAATEMNRHQEERV